MSTAESCTVDTGKATFSVGQVGLVAVAAATDIFTITGAAGRKIKVLRIEVSGIATAASTQPYSVLKRTTANTGGTATVLSPATHDGTAVPAAVVRTYTANPTTGTLQGIVQAKRGTLLTVAAASPASPTSFDFTTLGSKFPTLNSENDVLALNFNGATAAGNALDVFATWTEE